MKAKGREREREKKKLKGEWMSKDKTGCNKVASEVDCILPLVVGFVASAGELKRSSRPAFKGNTFLTSFLADWQVCHHFCLCLSETHTGHWEGNSESIDHVGYYIITCPEWTVVGIAPTDLVIWLKGLHLWSKGQVHGDTLSMRGRRA